MNLIIRIRQELQELADDKTKASFNHYFKEKVIAHGVKTTMVTRTGNKYFQEIKHLSKKDIFEICEELLKSDYNEEAFIACGWAYAVHKQYEVADFSMFERWIYSYINNWAKCDTLCNHAVGELVTMFPELVNNLKLWARSPNRWVKRAAAVTLIIPAKKGQFLPDIFQIADILLVDKDDMVQKGYGWMLKEASRMHQTEVFAYVVKNKNIMPRTALRYAIEKMPVELKRKAMEKE